MKVGLPGSVRSIMFRRCDCSAGYYRQETPPGSGASEFVGPTNIRLRWSGKARGRRSLLQTFGSAGAGKRVADGRYYKHSAPLEREKRWPTVGTTNIPLRWSGKARGRRSVLQTFRSAGAGKRVADGRNYKHSVPLERESAWPTSA